MVKKTLSQYKDGIVNLHGALSDYPDNEALQKKLKYRISKWVDLLDITYYIASNEQTPWDMTGLNTKPMPLKRSSGYPQTGDYLFTITDDTGVEQWGQLCVERKSCSDLYGSLMRSENRERIYSEIKRYENDKRFTQMIIIVECTQAEFLSYIPKFNGKRYNKNHIGANVASRRATVAGLYARGVPILWAGSRIEAEKIYLQLVRQSIIKNYQ